MPNVDDEIDDHSYSKKSSDVLAVDDYVTRYFVIEEILGAAEFGWAVQLLNELDVRTMMKVRFTPVSSSEAIEEIDPYSSDEEAGEAHKQREAAGRSEDFDVTILFGIFANSENDLEQATKDLNSKADELGVSLTVLQHQLKAAFKTLETGSWEIENPMRMSKEGVAASTVAMEPEESDENHKNGES